MACILLWSFAVRVDAKFYPVLYLAAGMIAGSGIMHPTVPTTIVRLFLFLCLFF